MGQLQPKQRRLVRLTRLFRQYLGYQLDLLCLVYLERRSDQLFRRYQAHQSDQLPLTQRRLVRFVQLPRSDQLLLTMHLLHQ